MYADDQVGILVARHDAVQRATEVGDADAQHRGVERHVDAGHQDERALAAGDLATLLDLFLEHLEAANRARDGVLRAAQVEVHDLQVFPCALGDLVDEAGDVVVVEVDLRGADRGQSVVRPAVLVTRHDVVHLGTTVEHHLEQRLDRVDTGHATQRRVFTDRVTAGHRALDERTLLAHLGDLGCGDGRHGDLGELRQVAARPRGGGSARPLAIKLVGLSRTTCSTEKPRVSRVNLSAVSHTLRAALDRPRTSMPMPLCWMP